jgi:hypothetical protein
MKEVPVLINPLAQEEKVILIEGLQQWMKKNKDRLPVREEKLLMKKEQDMNLPLKKPGKQPVNAVNHEAAPDRLLFIEKLFKRPENFSGPLRKLKLQTDLMTVPATK